MTQSDPSQSLFDQIIDHMMLTLKDKGQFDKAMLDRLRSIAESEQLSKYQSIVRELKVGMEECK
jgi:hypothetical protein